MASQTATSFTIGELSEAADVTARTIRYYVAEGLLEPPGGGGRGATYNEEQLARLRLIKRLKDEHLPLNEISDLLGRLEGNEVMELLEEHQPAEPAPTAAKDYLQDLMAASQSPSESDRLRHRLRARVSERGASRPSDAIETEWRRIPLTPDVELHIRSRPGSSAFQHKMDKLVQFARGLFGEER